MGARYYKEYKTMKPLDTPQEIKQQFIKELQDLCDNYGLHISSTMYGDLAIFLGSIRYTIDTEQDDTRYTKVSTSFW